MTKKERERISRLLRCAADIVRKTARPVATARTFLDEGLIIWNRALGARAKVADGNTIPPHDAEEYRAQLLEAAQRIEEGSYP